jgi:hypothetical protein
MMVKIIINTLEKIEKGLIKRDKKYFERVLYFGTDVVLKLKN